MSRGSGSAVGREGSLFLALGVVLVGMTVALLTTSRMSQAESATPTPKTASPSARVAAASHAPSGTSTAPASALATFNVARVGVGASPLSVTQCATRAAAEYADSLPPVVPAAGSGWADAAVWCDGRSMSFGFERGNDRTGVAMAKVVVADGVRRAQLTDASHHEFGDVIVSIGSAATPEYVLAWSVG